MGSVNTLASQLLRYGSKLFRIGGNNLFEEFITALPEEFWRRLCFEGDFFVVRCLH